MKDILMLLFSSHRAQKRGVSFLANIKDGDFALSTYSSLSLIQKEKEILSLQSNKSKASITSSWF